jgi:hypothetical protein
MAAKGPSIMTLMAENHNHQGKKDKMLATAMIASILLLTATITLFQEPARVDPDHPIGTRRSGPGG